VWALPWELPPTWGHLPARLCWISGFTILAVNVDKTPAKAEVLLSEYTSHFSSLFDFPICGQQIVYDVSAMPTTVIVDRDGNQRLLH